MSRCPPFLPPGPATHPAQDETWHPPLPHPNWPLISCPHLSWWVHIHPAVKGKDMGIFQTPPFSFCPPPPINQQVLSILFFFFFWPWQEAGEVLVPNQALNPHLGQWNHWALITGLPGNPPILSLFLSFFNNFIYLFLATLGFHCCTGFSLAVECGLLLAVASFVAEHGLPVSRASEVVACGL